MHLVSEEIEARVVAQFLTTRVFRLWNVHIRELRKYTSKIVDEEERLLALDVYFQFLSFQLCIIKHFGE